MKLARLSHRLLAALSCAALLLAAEIALAQPASRAEAELEELASLELAPVMLDGAVLFRVRGVSTYTAEARARAISNAIRAVAADATTPVDSIAIRPVAADRYFVMAKGERLFVLVDADAELEQVSLSLLAESTLLRIVQAVRSYREDRTAGALLRSAIYALSATVAFLILLLITLRLFRRLQSSTRFRVEAKLEKLREKSGDSIQAGPVGMLTWGLISAIRIALIVFLSYSYLNFTLALFPWTRAVSKWIFRVALGPLQTLGNGFVDALPGLVFIVILMYLARYLIGVVRSFFLGVEQRRIPLRGFEPEWAEPTYRIVRGVLIVLFVVIAYPSIPGSKSEAFKGVSILVGILFSIGSSSLVANIVAGYTMIYRRAFRIGDRIRVAEYEGIVSDKSTLVTYLRTFKNEEVVVPNSTLLNSTLTNLSTLARDGKLILHTTVAIGYATPWRQVEALLLLAAERTTSLLKTPAPFVLQRGLGTFAVDYELNVYTDDAQRMAWGYTELHRNILDVFNEFGVQIMTPAYEGDPDAPKVVTREDWYTEPARPAVERPRGPTGSTG